MRRTHTVWVQTGSRGAVGGRPGSLKGDAISLTGAQEGILLANTGGPAGAPTVSHFYADVAVSVIALPASTHWQLPYIPSVVVLFDRRSGTRLVLRVALGELVM